MTKWYAFTTPRVAKWAVERFAHIEAQAELPRTEFEHHETDARIIWIKEDGCEDVQGVEEQFEDMLTSFDRELYVIIPLPPIHGPNEVTHET